MFLLASMIPVAYWLPDPWDVIGVGMLLLGFVAAFLVAIAWLRRPPGWLKPAWLLEMEAERPPPPVVARGFVGLLDRAMIGLLPFPP